MADSTVEFDVSKDKPVDFTSKLSEKDCVDAVRELEMIDPRAALKFRHLVGNDKAMQALADFIREKYGVEPKPALAENEFRVVVRYEPVPDIQELRKRFDSVGWFYDGRPFEDHSSRKDADRTPREVTFLVKRFGKPITSEQAIAWGLKNGWLPAIREETIAFAVANPDLQRKFWIAALGSSVLLHVVERFVPILYTNGSRLGLDATWFESEWDDDYLFLFVRK